MTSRKNMNDRPYEQQKKDRNDVSRLTTARITLDVDAQTSVRMGNVRQKDTCAEQAVRKILHHMGIRFRIHNRDLPGSPDIANRRKRWAIFVHGCFWHSHQDCQRATIPKRNRDFWEEKFATNRARDQRNLDLLKGLGYSTLALWECDIEQRPVEVQRQLTEFLGHTRPHPSHQSRISL